MSLCNEHKMAPAAVVILRVCLLVGNVSAMKKVRTNFSDHLGHFDTLFCI